MGGFMSRRRFNSFTLIFLGLSTTVSNLLVPGDSVCSRDSLCNRKISHSDQAAKFHQGVMTKPARCQQGQGRSEFTALDSSKGTCLPAEGLLLASGRALACQRPRLPGSCSRIN